MLSQPHNQGILDLKTVAAYTVGFQRAESSNTDFIMAFEFFSFVSMLMSRLSRLAAVGKIQKSISTQASPVGLIYNYLWERSILWSEFQKAVDPRCYFGFRSNREGVKCPPLDHMRQIPYIHPALFRSYSKFNFFNIVLHWKVFQLFLLYCICLSTVSICHLRMHFSRTIYFKVQIHF